MDKPEILARGRCFRRDFWSNVDPGSQGKDQMSFGFRCNSLEAFAADER
jgi:hypothetical protein